MTENQKNWALWHTEKIRERFKSLSDMGCRYSGQPFRDVIARTMSEDIDSYYRTMCRLLHGESNNWKVP